ncbi:MAG: cupin domain-containing protein [Myxococcota bacterium]
MALDVATLVERLGLLPHPEGGWFRETWRAGETVARDALPARFAGPRAHGTAILFLLEAGQFSALHRIASDEVWCFHLGAPLVVHVLGRDGIREDLVLGHDVGGGQRVQAVVPHGALFGARVLGDAGYALVSCTVAPGFDFADFVMPSRAELVAALPQHAALIAELTRA